MANYLVIVESPAKAKTIGKFLGRNYKVKASVGHVRDLPKSKMGVDIEDDFEPGYITIRGKGDVIKALRSEAKKADKIFLATDPDREGEAIAWHLQTLLAKEGRLFSRIAFNAITKDEVKNAIKNGRSIDMQLVDAQQARRVLDRLVGYSISPILWRKIRRGLSAGRVQSVATRMICDKEREIEAFVSEEYWSIEGEFSSKEEHFTAQFYGVDDKKVALKNKTDVDAVIERLGDTYTVQDVQKSKRQRKPYPPFITSSLQQEAANQFGFSTKKTMMLAQQLYEGIALDKGTVGLITYMRTDSMRIAPEASQSIMHYIESSYGADYKGVSTTAKNGKGAQDAHEAIRPSDITLTPDMLAHNLKRDQLRLYQLIWARAVASHMAPAVFEQVSAKILNGSVQFRASGSTMMFDGFLSVYNYSKSTISFLPIMQAGDRLNCHKINPEQHFTQPPARYTEATLVKAMEELGIGRPSTYAPTISTILSRGYVAKEKKSLLPTELGNLINDIMMAYFDDIVDVTFTAQLEDRLDAVEESNLPWKNVIRDFYGKFNQDLEKAEAELERVELVEETDEVCDDCGAMMLIKHGRFGKFLACSRYPDCTHTRPILNRVGVKCPKCQVGDVIERKTKKYKTFYGCSNFPDCRFMSWHIPTGEACPKCSDALIDYKTKKKHEVICMNKKCDYKKAASKTGEPDDR